LGHGRRHGARTLRAVFPGKAELRQGVRQGHWRRPDAGRQHSVRALDIVVPPGVDLDAALEVKRHWEGTDNVVRADVVGRIIHLEPQFRPDIARPQFGLTEQPVRQALYQAVNRQQLAEFMTYGFGPLADSYYQPDEPRRPDLAIPQFRYDPSVAPAMLTSV